jgi:hypothetical protein
VRGAHTREFTHSSVEPAGATTLCTNDGSSLTNFTRSEGSLQDYRTMHQRSNNDVKPPSDLYSNMVSGALLRHPV